MSKRVIMVHGWEGSPNDAWLPWLKQELQSRGFDVSVPVMPNPDVPEMTSWISHLDVTVGEANNDTYFVGHSIGCQTILRYIEQLEGDKQIGGVVCVAGFFRLPHLATDEEKEIAKPWLETPIDCERIKKHVSGIIAIFSDNDPDVDLGDKELFEERLGAKTVVEHNMGHFSDDAGVTELPSALDAVLEIAGERQ